MIHILQKNLVSQVTFALIFVLLFGCGGKGAGIGNDVVVITYGPILNAPTHPGKTGVPGAAGTPIQEFGMLCCIHSIKNTDTNAQDFKFDIAYLKPQSGVFVPTTYPSWTLPDTIDVDDGTEKKDLGIIIVREPAAGLTEQEMAARWPTFIYQNPQKPNESVVVVQYPPSPQPKWVSTWLLSSVPQVDRPDCQAP